MNKLEVNNISGSFLTYNQCAEKTNLGRSTVMRLVKESGALVKIGKTARVNWNVFYDYIIKKYSVKSEVIQ